MNRYIPGSSMICSMNRPKPLRLDVTDGTPITVHSAGNVSSLMEKIQAMKRDIDLRTYLKRGTIHHSRLAKHSQGRKKRKKK